MSGSYTVHLDKSEAAHVTTAVKVIEQLDTSKEQQRWSCFYFKISLFSSPLESRYMLLLYIIVVLKRNKCDRKVIETYRNTHAAI